jgi:hypothetical protein
VAKYNIAISWDPANGITMVIFFSQNLASPFASRRALWYELLRSQLGRCLFQKKLGILEISLWANPDIPSTVCFFAQPQL